MTTASIHHSSTLDTALSGDETQPIGLCLTCNYSLRGLPTARCPECGREFDPMDPATMNMGRELSATAKWVLGPVRWPVNLATWAALLFALWFARLPGGQIRSSPALLILIGLGLLWLAWPVLRVMAARKYGWPHSLLMRGQKQRIAVGAALMLASAAIVFALPFRAAVAVSRPAMDRMAQQIVASVKPYGEDQWVGLYPARRIKQVPGGMRFTVEERNRAYKSGFTYLPKVDPKRVGWSNKNYRYLGGGWWSWREEG
jgi:hypothetical protein